MAISHKNFVRIDRLFKEELAELQFEPVELIKGYCDKVGDGTALMRYDDLKEEMAYMIADLEHEFG